LRARTIGEDLSAAAAAFPGKTAVAATTGSLTYAELDAAASKVAAGVADLGIERGDRVSALMRNDLEAAVTVYGVMRAGAVLAPLHPTLKGEKLARLLDDSGSRALITDADNAETAHAGAPSDVSLVEEARELAGDRRPRPPVSVDPAAIVYTSGSTGEPNGVTLTHANMTFVADSIIESLGLRADDRILSVLPLSFGYGLYQLLTSVRTGSTLVLRHGLGLLGELVKTLQRERITFLPGVPTLFEMLISFEGLDEVELPDLRALTNAGAGLPVATIETIRRLLPGAQLVCMYGQTECQRVCYLPPQELESRMGSVGIAIPGTEVWMEDDDGNRVQPGEVGELFVRGAHVMQGYWSNPEATARKLRPGPAGDRVLATGDLFRQDDDGYLYFVSRRDDMIKSRGEKVPPAEVEEVLRAAEGVREAAVIGVPDRLLGEAVQAHVAPRPGAELSERALLTRCAQLLEDYMVPRKIVIHAELPKTPNGKLDRRALADAGADR
jgi:amino acid adenylation domain-containing protein